MISLFGKQHNQAQKEKKQEKQMPTTPDDKSDDFTQPRCSLENSTTLLCLRIAAYQATPSRRTRTTMLLLPGRILGFLSVHRGECGKGILDALQEGRWHPQAPSRRCRHEPAETSSDPHTTTPQDHLSAPIMLATHQHAPSQ